MNHTLSVSFLPWPSYGIWSQIIVFIGLVQVILSMSECMMVMMMSAPAAGAEAAAASSSSALLVGSMSNNRSIMDAICHDDVTADQQQFAAAYF